MQYLLRPLALFGAAAWLAVSPAQAQLKAPAEPGLKPSTALGASARPQPAPAAEPAVADKEAAGKLAAQGWLLLLDRRDWGTAWEGSAQMFRSTVPLAAWMDGAPKVREPLGRLQERTAIESVHKTELEGRPAGDYVTTRFAAKFEKKEVEEIVTTVREPDGRFRVTGYSTR